MMYAPHILQVKQVLPFQEDEFGHAIPGTGGEQWVTLCRCRCDDNTTKELSPPMVKCTFQITMCYVR